MKTLSASSVGAVSNRILYIVSMNHAVNDGSVYLLSSLFPIVTSLFGLSVLQVGVLVAIGYLVNVVSQPLIGRYSEGKDPKKLLALGMSIISLSVVSFVLATDFLFLLVSVVLLRVGSSFFHPVGFAAVSNAYEGPKLERAMGFQTSFGYVGILLVFLAAVPVYLAVGWKATFLIFAIFGVLDAAVTLGMFGAPASVGHEKVDENSADNSPKSGRGRLGIPFFFVATTFIGAGSYAVVINFANIFLKNQTHLDVFGANIIVSAWIASAFLGSISTGMWAKILRRSLLLSFSYFISAITILAFALLSASLSLVILTLLLNGFFISATFPLTYVELSKHLRAEAHRSGQSFGIIFSANTIGSSILGLLTGYLSQAFGLTLAFETIGFLTLIPGALALQWTRSVRFQPRAAKNARRIVVRTPGDTYSNCNAGSLCETYARVRGGGTSDIHVVLKALSSM
jgi:FSR family fosmidomycin resistance protein-like MFS transporter